MSASITAIAGHSSAPPSVSGNAGVAQERVILSKLVRTYQASLNNGKEQDSLRPIARQIANASSQLGVITPLPQQTVTPASTVAANEAPAPASRVDLRL